MPRGGEEKKHRTILTRIQIQFRTNKIVEKQGTKQIHDTQNTHTHAHSVKAQFCELIGLYVKQLQNDDSVLYDIEMCMFDVCLPVCLTCTYATYTHTHTHTYTKEMVQKIFNIIMLQRVALVTDRKDKTKRTYNKKHTHRYKYTNCCRNAF